MAKSQQSTDESQAAEPVDVAPGPAEEAAPPGQRAPAAEQPKGMFPSSPGESADMIAERRTQMADAERRQREAQADLNRLRNEVEILNSLRQANGQGIL